MRPVHGAPVASWLAFLALLGCAETLAPLQQPLLATAQIGPAIHVAISDADLAEMSEYIRQSPDNKSVAIPLSPLTVPETGELSAASLQVDVATGTAELTDSGVIKLAWPVTFKTTGLVLTVGGGGCELAWTAEGGQLSISFLVTRDGAGVPAALLAQASALTLEGTKLADQGGCLAGAVSGAGSAISKHLATAASAGLTSRYEQSAASAIGALLPLAMERRGRLELQVGGESIEVRLDNRFLAAKNGAEGSLLERGNGDGRIAVSIGFDVDRHTCARDEPPPKPTMDAISVIGPSAGPDSAPLRRAFVIQRDLLAHLGWAAARSGLLCRGIKTGLESSLSASWAGDVLPPLSAWVHGGPVGAAFWPGSAPQLKVKDLGQDAGIEWLFPDALLELSATVGGLEMVVLRIEGGFRVTTWPQWFGPTGGALEVRSAAVDSAVVSSPLSPATKPAEAPLANVVNQALAGIFGSVQGLPNAGAGLASQVMRTARDGEHLWIWTTGAPLGAP